ncbi:MAG: ABC transporter ATP-binding protein [Alphaproteobacteria bacterium]|nr:ABC transporter ATP-binding protein [Alphaproteobacteria bacterium]
MANDKAEQMAGPPGPAISLRQTAYQGMSDSGDPRLGDDAAVLWRIIGLILRYRFRVGVAVGATVMAAVFQLMIPRFLGNAVDHALGLLGDGTTAPEVARAALFEAAVLLLGASILRGAFTLLHNYGGEAIGHLIAYDLRLAFYRKLQQLSFSFHDRVHTGELITRGMLDLEGVRMFVNTGVLRLVLLIVLIGAGAYLLISTDLLLGLLSLSFVPFVAWRSSAARLRLRALWLALQQRMGTLGQIMDENLAGIRVVRAFGAEPYEISKYDVAADAAMEISDARIKTRAASTSIMTFAYFISMGLVLWVGGLRVLDGAMTVGTLTVFLTFITILQQPVRQLGLLVNSIARASTCGGRLFAVLDLAPAIRDQAGAVQLLPTDGTIRFEEVSFAYSGAGGPPVLHDVSFTVARGRTLGIVGPPGSGKSTIANLLPRYYDPSAGRISIDGHDIRDVTLDSLRRAVRVVQQDAFLFTASLENNIAYGDPWADDGMIQDAASTAQIDGFIGALPDGYGTLVGERGVSLSGGQKQRVAIARAAMLGSAVLVFDDSTAAIDAETERRIREALKPHMADCATIIISHRLGALRHADEIIFLEAGRIVERGNHDSLIAEDGRYAALFALQSRDDGDIAAAAGGTAGQ